MQISWLLLAENIVVKEHSERIDIIGEFRSVLADGFPYLLPKFYIVCRIEGDVRQTVALPYELTLRSPSNELVEIHTSSVSVDVPPNVRRVVGNLIAEIKNFEFMNQGRYTITAQLGDSVISTDFLVISRQNDSDDAQE